jgi:serine/threonine protein kinase
MEQKIKDYIELVLKEKIIKMTVCSRLTWKNIVYYCETNKREYAVKLYKKYNDACIRSNVEVTMYRILQNVNINTPKIYYMGELDEYYILINEWIKGVSLKEIINNSGVIQNKNLIECLLDDYKFVWNLKVDDDIRHLLNSNRLEKCDTASMIYTRVNLSEDNLFYKFKKIENIELVKKIYDKLKKEVKVEEFIINSDISLHEVLINKKGDFWIDLEAFTIGNINNDLAGIFYSLSNSIIEQREEIECLMDIIKDNQYFSFGNFIFYLIERIFCANYLNAVNQNEINFYINYILEKEI